MENIINSMKGSKRATPSPELFARIEQEIYKDKKEFNIIPMRYAAAAAILLLLLNGAAYFAINQTDYSEYSNSNMITEMSIVSDYQIYE